MRNLTCAVRGPWTRTSGTCQTDLSGYIERRGRVPNNHAAQPEEDLVRLYLNDIGKHALLTKDDEARLAQAIEAGREARLEFAAAKGITSARKRGVPRLVLGWGGGAE